MKNVMASAGLGIGLWLSAIIGIALKLAFPRRVVSLAIGVCRLLGWSGVTAYDSLGICASELKPMASRNRRHPLFARHGLSRLAGPAISQRNLARLCPARGELPLLGGPRMLAVGISECRR